LQRNVLKKWVSDNEKEERRRNIVIKGMDIPKEIEKGRERRRWVKEFIKERLGVHHNLSRINKTVIIE